jgi:hypothetical protein
VSVTISAIFLVGRVGLTILRYTNPSNAGVQLGQMEAENRELSVRTMKDPQIFP